MSADSWAKCPKCKPDETDLRAARMKEAEESYGRVPPEEYAKLLAHAEATRNPDEDNETLREDWEPYIDDKAVFHVDYRGECQRCGFLFVFSHKGSVLK